MADTFKEVRWLDIYFASDRRRGLLDVDLANQFDDTCHQVRQIQGGAGDRC